MTVVYSTTLKLRIAMMGIVTIAMLPKRVVLFVSVTALMASGCGGGGASSAPTTNGGGSGGTTGSAASNPGTGAAANDAAATVGSSAPLTKTQFVASANAICKRLHQQLLVLNRGKTPDTQQVYLRGAAYEQMALGKLQKLNPPTELSGDLKQVVATLSTLAEDSTKYVEYVKTKNMSKANALANSYAPIKQQGVEVTLRDGLKECTRAF
jgi:ABC-type glycerol-3-phosphate transport system substrate-binding protein